MVRGNQSLIVCGERLDYGVINVRWDVGEGNREVFNHTQKQCIVMERHTEPNVCHRVEGDH